MKLIDGGGSISNPLVIAKNSALKSISSQETTIRCVLPRRLCYANRSQRLELASGQIIHVSPCPRVAPVSQIIIIPGHFKVK